MNDVVNHPAHYTQGKIECIDFITDKKLNFCRGNAIKYIVRAGLKDKAKEIEDLEKAIFYIKREIFDLRKVADGASCACTSAEEAVEEKHSCLDCKQWIPPKSSHGTIGRCSKTGANVFAGMACGAWEE